MWVLGISAYHGDSAAALIKDGELVAAVEEERFTRVKHWAGFPVQAVASCLAQGGIGLDRVDAIAVNRDASAQRLRKLLFVLRNRPSPRFVLDRLRSRHKLAGLDVLLAKQFSVPAAMVRARMCCVEHHIAHAASAYCFSPFERAALITVDGFGDWTSCFAGMGQGARIDPLFRVFYPHSLGVVYTAVTQFLGFPNYGDEYKVMGLAPYGKPIYLDRFEKLVQVAADGTFTLNTRFFSHADKGMELRWDNGEPIIGTLYAAPMIGLFGQPRHPQDPITQRHKDIAASLQKGYEAVFFAQLAALQRATGQTNLCIAGGCAMNSVANGRVFERSGFKEMFVPPQPGDGGGAVGAAAWVYARTSGKRCRPAPDQAYLGPAYEGAQLTLPIDKLLGSRQDIVREQMDDEQALCDAVAREIAAGKVVGWFQGRMEWGPRALGNRSILADPRRPDMKDILNLKIKRRESFRPFAPSILREAVGDYFETDYGVPFMSAVFMIKADKRPLLPAITHVDGSGRLQSVAREENPRYWKLIHRFGELTGVPVLLNTSFNENEPIVCTPQQALDCFIRTDMDTIVIGNHVIRRDRGDGRQ